MPMVFAMKKYDVFVEINAAPTPISSIDGAVEICPNSTYSYQANGLPINEINWTVTGGTPSSFKGNPYQRNMGQFASV